MPSADEVKEAFGLFDKGGSGKVSADDFGTVIRALGFNPTEDELSGGRGGCGLADATKLAAALEGKPKEDTEGKIIDAFKVFDVQNNGMISSADLKHVMTSIGEKLTKEQAEQMMSEADVDGKGNLNYEEFVKTILSK